MSRKLSCGNRRRLRRKRHWSLIEAGNGRLEQILAHDHSMHASGAVFGLHSRGRCEVSQAVLDVMAEELADAPEPGDFRAAVILGVLGWNLAVLEESGDPEAFNKIIARGSRGLPPELAFILRTLLPKIRDRKREMFPALAELIRDYEITITGQRRELTVLTQPTGQYVSES
jgi:hypothetical protein